MRLKRTNSLDTDFISLAGLLDSDLNARYGVQQSEYAAHNQMESISTLAIGYEGDEPIACGCFRKFDSKTVEIKRMFVATEHRGKGYSKELLAYLESWALDLGFSKAVLEMGKGQPEGAGLYRKSGYSVIENYGPYANLENSICMKKELSVELH